VKSKKKQASENFLENIPLRTQYIPWSTDDKGIVTLDIENKGVFNRIAQKLLKKPKVTYVHLDEMGSFIWPLLDESRNIIELGKLVKEQFGDKAEPLYERLVQYLKILESYKFIQWK